METSILLDDCCGFGPQAIALWDNLRYGIPDHLGPSSSTESESIYLSFEGSEEPASLAVRCARLRSILNSKLHVVSRGGDHFAALLSTMESSSSVRFMDLIGGILFRSPENVSVIVPVEDLDAVIPRCLNWMASEQLPDQKWFTRRFSEASDVLETVRRILSLLLVRDLLRSFAHDARPLPISIRDLCSSLGFDGYSPSVVEDMNAAISSMKPKIENTKLMEAWEHRVAELYNRTPRPLQRKKTDPSRSTRASKRSRKASKKFGTESDVESMDLVVDNEVKLVVDNWLQCDNCSKWRVVDSSIAQAFEDKFFCCTEVGKTCADPSDDQT